MLSPDQIHVFVAELFDAHRESLPEGLRGVTHSSRT